MEQDGSPSLEFTGERFHPELEGEIRQEHMHRYAWCRDLAAGKDVIDVASGEGFGSAMLAEQAKSVIGIDVSAEAVAHATGRYVKPNLQFRVGDAAAIDLPDASADMIVSFETIEHIDDQEGALSQFSRILREDGILVISSPNVEIYSTRQEYDNPFHTKELNREDFISLLKQHFGAVQIFGQRMLMTSAMLPSEASSEKAEVLVDDGEIRRVTRESPESMYFVAVAARNASYLPARSASFLLSDKYDVYWQQKDNITQYGAELARIQDNLVASSAEVVRLSGALMASDAEVTRLSNVLMASDAEVARLSNALVASDTEVARLRNALIASRTEAGLKNQLKNLGVIEKSGLFDAKFYAGQRSGAKLRSWKLLEDYIINGEKAGLAPSADFDPRFYAATYLDVAESGMGLLMHYVIAGKKEGRLAKAP